MKRQDLEHIIRAAAEVTNEYDLIVVGSQSILGKYPNAPDELLMSLEADLYPRNYRPELADAIDGCIGEESPFHTLHGYYAQGVGPETARLPEGWEQRTIAVQNQNTNLKAGHCLEPHDLACAKLAAAREKDFKFVEALIRHKLIDTKLLVERLVTMQLNHEASLIRWLDSIENEEPPETDS